MALMRAWLRARLHAGLLHLRRQRIGFHALGLLLAARGAAGRRNRRASGFVLLNPGAVVLEPLAVFMAVRSGPAHRVHVPRLADAHFARLGAEIEDGFVKAVLHRSVIPHRLLLAGLFKPQVHLAVESRSRGLDLRDPLVEALRLHAQEPEVHAREARSAVLAREAVVLPFLV